MIPRSRPIQNPPDWQKALAEAIRDPQNLYRALNLDPNSLPESQLAHQEFRLLVPHAYLAKMKKGDPDDPLLRQVLPSGAELDSIPDFVADPVGDLKSMVLPGLLHKYHGRVLLVTTGACAIHCRYCFRRHFPYSDANPASEEWQPALDYIRQQTEIREVILSGGDPLVLSDRRLRALSRELDAIPNLTTLRIHTRLPLVLPQRINPELLDWLSQSRLKVVVVLHANHANEIDDATQRACQQLRQSGATLLNQTVLLKGINDSVSALQQLSERLFTTGVLPYYLHLLDRVAGAGHYECNPAIASQLMHDLRCRLPGYLVPRLVREESGIAFKTPQI